MPDPTVNLYVKDGKLRCKSEHLEDIAHANLMAFLARCKKELTDILSASRPPMPAVEHCPPPEVSQATPAPIRENAGPFRKLINRQEDLTQVLWAIDETQVVAVDLETAGLNPRADRTRLITLGTDRGTYLIDCFAVDPTPIFEVLGEDHRELVFHNAQFDLQFLAKLGFQPTGKVTCTYLLAQLLAAGTRDRTSLQACCQRYLGIELNKTEQKSDWAGTLTQTQLEYAAKDVEVLRPLLQKLRTEIKTGFLEEVAELELRALRGIVWMGSNGVAFARDRWQALADQAKVDVDRIAGELDAKAPKQADTLEGCTSWNWASPQQVKEVLNLCGHSIESTADDVLATITHPIGELLRQHREASKKATSFGRDWITQHVSPDGRVYPQWRQLGADSGRMSCQTPNLQQIPRGKDYRSCFAAPPGKVLVKADFSQIELRIAAKITQDKNMMAAYRDGKDLHVQTAALLLGKHESAVSKADRQIAKSANFGLIYGMGAKSYRDYARTSYGVTMTLEQAQEYRRKFFNAYPGLRLWHSKAGATNNQAIDTRTLTKRRRRGVSRFTEKLNTPVQGTGADGLKAALALLWERREQCPSAFPIMAIHDEIVVEANNGQAELAAAWLKAAMIDAMAPLVDPVPCEVDVTIAQTWGGAD